jgi:hypothetical protein
MKALAKTWTWIGQAFVPLAIGWSVYVRGGLDGPHLEEGVLISRGYWGLLVTLVVGVALSIVAALYIREARRARAQTLVPPNTMLEESDRNTAISWVTLAVFAVSVVSAFVLFLVRYLDSKLHTWNGASPLASGFWSSRIKAHDLGCDSSPCYALAQRLYGTNPVSGVNEYKLYLTDGVLVFLAVAFCIAAIFLIYELVKAPPPQQRYGR